MLLDYYFKDISIALTPFLQKEIGQTLIIEEYVGHITELF